MSDIFDHRLDAYEDHWSRGGYTSSKRSRKTVSNDSDYSYSTVKTFMPNRYYYHVAIEYEHIVCETDKAVLFKTAKFEQGVWIPKSKLTYTNVLGIDHEYPSAKYVYAHKNCVTYVKVADDE
jgi:hypothetical protein